MGKMKLERKIEKLKKKLKKYDTDRRTDDKENVPINPQILSPEEVDDLSLTDRIEELPLDEPNHVQSLQDNLTAKEASPTLQECPIIDESIATLLGNDESPVEPESSHIHDDLVRRWTNILKNGLSKEVHEQLSKKYPPPSNFIQIRPPKINPEVIGAVSEAMIDRDKKMVSRQDQIANIVTCLGAMLTEMLQSNIDTKYIEATSDAVRMLCDLHFKNSEIRRALLLPNLNKTIRDITQNIKVDEYLFGEGLTDKIKNFKVLERSAKEIQVPAKKNPPKPTKSNNQGNYRGPPAFIKNKPQTAASSGGLKYAQRPQPLNRTRPARYNYMENQQKGRPIQQHTIHKRRT